MERLISARATQSDMQIGLLQFCSKELFQSETSVSKLE